MRTMKHMNKDVTLFPFPNMVRINVVTAGGERLLDMIYRGFRKRQRIEYFKRQQRRKRKERK